MKKEALRRAGIGYVEVVAGDTPAELRRVVERLTALRVRVEGHTDSRGGDSFNLRLSQSRSESVRAYLIRRGVSPDRMEARGFGETVPIADNRTDAGRAQNRRVEFIITSQ